MSGPSDRPEEEGLRGFDVSRETLDRLHLLVAELRRWQGIKNLVGPGTPFGSLLIDVVKYMKETMLT